MSEEELPLPEESPLCQVIERDGKSVRVDIYRGSEGWILDVVDEHNGSLVWDDEFASDQAALDEVHNVIKNMGIGDLIGPPPGAS